MAVTTTPSRQRPAVAARRFGYVVAVLVNLALLYAVNAWPGWDALPFLPAIGVVAMVALWRVFPFDFGDATFDWSLVVRILLALGIVGGAIGVLTNLMSLFSDSGSRS